MRTASPTHPWINFTFQVGQLGPSTWMLIGEALSKCSHLSGSPLKPSVAAELAKVYLAKGVHATTAIEGNTLSEDEVRERIEGRRDLPPSREYLGQEVDNVIEAIKQIDEALRGVNIPRLDVERILWLHAAVLRGLENPPDDEPGVLRSHKVGVGRYAAPEPSQVRELLTNLVAWLAELEVPDSESIEQRFLSALIRAILAHLYIAWIHPFGNGNGRTARLIEVQILAGSGLVPLVATNLLSDHYNKTRTKYYERLDAASTRGDVNGFIHYAIQGFVEELREQISVVKAHNVAIAWESYIHETFGRQAQTQAKGRQRRVALTLPHDRFVTRDEVIELTPRVAADYARCGERTPARDLNDLVKMGLVERQGRAYRAKMETILAFRSPVHEREHLAHRLPPSLAAARRRAASM